MRELADAFLRDLYDYLKSRLKHEDHISDPEIASKGWMIAALECNGLSISRTHICIKDDSVIHVQVQRYSNGLYDSTNSVEFELANPATTPENIFKLIQPGAECQPSAT
jgi:hypothetical protein